MINYYKILGIEAENNDYSDLTVKQIEIAYQDSVKDSSHYRTIEAKIKVLRFLTNPIFQPHKALYDLELKAFLNEISKSITNYYEILKINVENNNYSNVTKEQINTAYRKIPYDNYLFEKEPRKYTDIAVAAAFLLIMKPDRKKLYDSELKNFLDIQSKNKEDLPSSQSDYAISYCCNTVNLIRSNEYSYCR